MDIGVGASAGQATGDQVRNEVVLAGRLAACVEERELPSGDVVACWRLVVGRPPRRRPAPAGVRTVTVDTLDCVTWAAGVRRTVSTWQAGDVVLVHGALRRRFWRGQAGPTSSYEVEVFKAKRLARNG